MQAINKSVDNMVSTRLHLSWNLHIMSFPLPEKFAKFLLDIGGGKFINSLG
jgi:hypothetical protein